MRLWMFTTLFILFVLGLHGLAELYYWYYFLWWYDVMMHFLGGVAMGFVGGTLWFWLYEEKRPAQGKMRFLQCVFILGFVGLIGIGWEWFEAGADTILVPLFDLPRSQPGLIDTMLDFYFDLLGGIIAFAIVVLIEKKVLSQKSI